MIDFIVPTIPDVYKPQASMSFRRQVGMNGHHTNQQFKTHEDVEWEYVKYPPNPLGRHPFNVIMKEVVCD